MDRINNIKKTEYEIYNNTVILDPGAPNTIQEAMNGQERNKWIPSLKLEAMNFIKRNSYLSKDEPTKTERKLDGTKKWKSRLSVKGSHQIPGVDPKTNHIMLQHTIMTQAFQRDTEQMI